MKQNGLVCVVGPVVLLSRVLISNFDFRPEKLPGLLRNGPQLPPRGGKVYHSLSYYLLSRRYRAMVWYG